MGDHGPLVLFATVIVAIIAEKCMTKLLYKFTNFWAPASDHLCEDEMESEDERWTEDKTYHEDYDEFDTPEDIIRDQARQIREMEEKHQSDMDKAAEIRIKHLSDQKILECSLVMMTRDRDYYRNKYEKLITHRSVV